MKLAIQNREAIRKLLPALEQELDSAYAAITETFTREHTWDGRHTNISVESISQTPLTQYGAAQAGIIQQSVRNNYMMGVIGNAGDVDLDYGSSSGSGTGDVVGPSSSGDTNIAIFDGITGKLLADSGVTITSLQLGLINLASFTSTNAMILAGGVHGTIVTAVVGKTIVPLRQFMHANILTGYSTGRGLNVQYNGINTDIFTAGTPINTVIEDVYWQMSLSDLTRQASPIGLSLVIRSGAAVTGGNAANTIVTTLPYVLL